MRVPVEPLAEAMRKSDKSLSQVARDAGYVRTLGDITRLRRALGIKAHSSGRPYTNTTIDYDKALLIAEAIGVDPVDVGL